MLKSIFSILNNGDGTIQVTINRLGDEYTVSIIPFDKPELALCINGKEEDVIKDILTVTPKYKAVIKTAMDKVLEIETKVKEAAKPKAKGKKEEPKKAAAPGLLDTKTEVEEDDSDLEDEAADLEIAEQLETIENIVANETPVEELMPKESDNLKAIKEVAKESKGQIIVATINPPTQPVDDNLF